MSKELKGAVKKGAAHENFVLSAMSMRDLLRSNAARFMSRCTKERSYEPSAPRAAQEAMDKSKENSRICAIVQLPDTDVILYCRLPPNKMTSAPR